jgi:DNA polymerase-3 subunit delta'
MASMGWHITGHSWAADILQQQIAGGKLRHAYLFSGPTGVGRRTLALRFAQAVNCTQPPAPGDPCGKCQTCRQIERMQYTDLTVVQAKEAGAVLKVKQIRELQHTLSLCPYEGGYRVALLLRFEAANANAQNALLKTLEEPNPKVLLLLTVDDPENLLPTITSRCELLRLRPMAVDELAGVLEAQDNLPKDKAQLIAHISAGRAGFAKRLAGDAEMLEKRKQWMDDMLALLPAGKTERFHYSEKIIRIGKKDRGEAKRVLLEGMAYWLSFWRDVLLIDTKSGIQITNIDLRESVHRTAEEVESQDAARAVGALEHAFKRIQTANLQLMLDNILLDWPAVTAG